MATPFAGMPDEPAYLHYGINSIENIIGDPDTLKESTSFNLQNSACFAFHPEISANCQHFKNSGGAISAKSPLARYPKPWFYLTAWPALIFGGELGLLLAKLLAALLSMLVIFIGIKYWKRDKTSLPLLLFFALPPLSIQMLGSYNPNGFEIAGATAIGLMLFGRNFPDNPHSKTWWIWLTSISLLTATAKPMSGILVFATYALYFIYYFIEKITRNKFGKLSKKDFEFKNTIRFAIIAFFSMVISYLLTIPSIHDSDKNVLPSNDSKFGILFKFISNSENYFREYAGLYGWRDIGPAPWSLVIWISLMAIILNKAFSNAHKVSQLIMGGTWAFVLVVAPAVQSVALAEKYNVGLQTRYLSPYFAVAGIATWFVLQKSYKSLKSLIPFLIILNLVNFLWVYLRFAIGYPTFLQPPSNALAVLSDHNNWRPNWIGIMIFAIGVIILDLVMTFNGEVENKRVKNYIVAALMIPVSILAIITQLDYSKYESRNYKSAQLFSIESPIKTVGEILTDNYVEQQFRVPEDNFSSIQVQFATFSRVNKGILKVKIFDDKGAEVHSEIIEQKDIIDNAYRNINFKKQPKSEGRIYRLQITSDKTSTGSASTIWLAKATTLSGFALYVDGVRIDNTIIFKGFASN